VGLHRAEKLVISAQKMFSMLDGLELYYWNEINDMKQAFVWIWRMGVNGAGSKLRDLRISLPIDLSRGNIKQLKEALVQRT
jgi:hypothetical protein